MRLISYVILGLVTLVLYNLIEKKNQYFCNIKNLPAL